MKARFLLALCTLGMLAGAARADGLAQVRARGELRWGGDVQGGEPYAFEDASGKLVGFEVEIAQALARELGVRATFVQNDWSTLVPSLERGTFDVVLNGLEVTAARAGRVRFSRPYYVFAERLVARDGDSGIRDLASLRGRRVATLANSLAWEMLGEIGAERLPYEGVEEPFVDLQAGRVDAVLIDDIIADRYGRRPGLRAVGNVATGMYAMAVRKEDATLAAALDEALARMVRSGELREILARWKLDGERQNALATTPAQAQVPSRKKPLNEHQVWLFVRGAAVTLILSLAAMSLAVSLGLGLAVARLPSAAPGRRVLRLAATVYVEVFRGTPVLLQLYVIYFGLAPVLALDAFTAAVLGLGLNYAAYEAEIYRAGIQAVPAGEVEAAHALGMPGGLVLRRVVLPQAFRVALPGMTNDFIALLKDSSLVSVITVIELTKRMTITAVDVGSWLAPGLLCAGLYLAMSYPLSRLARRLETRLGGRA